MSQMQAPTAPGPGQPWLSSGSHSAPPVAPGQQVGQQPSAASSADAVSAFFVLVVRCAFPCIHYDQRFVQADLLALYFWIFQATNVPSTTQQSSSDWQEHASSDGRR